MRTLLALTILVLSPLAGPAQERPNIVFVLVDDLGYSDVGFNGATFYETPNIDALAADGMILSDFYSAGPNCSPTRASLMTGMYPPRHHNYTPGGKAKGDLGAMRFAVPNRSRSGPTYDTFVSYDNHLPGAHESVAEALARAGYVTARVGKWHLGEDNQGFTVSTSVNRLGRRKRGTNTLTEELTDAALGFIEENRSRPFFLYLAHKDVHAPLRAPEEIVAKYRAKRAALPEAAHDWNPVFAAMIETVDRSVGRLRAGLRELGLAENTVFLFSSDNGGSAYSTTNRPLRGAKGSLYEGGIRVPTCIAWPGVIAPGGRSGEPLTSVDLLPTLAELTGAPLPAGQPVDGESFVPILHGSGTLERDAIFWHFPLYLSGGDELLPVFDSDEGYWRAVPSSAIRKGGYKLIYYYEYDDYKLFDLASDISEEHDLASTMPEKAGELLAELRAWVRATQAPVPDRPNPAFGRR